MARLGSGYRPRLDTVITEVSAVSEAHSACAEDDIAPHSHGPQRCLDTSDE